MNWGTRVYAFRALYSSRLSGYFGATDTVKLYWKQVIIAQGIVTWITEKKVMLKFCKQIR